MRFELESGNLILRALGEDYAPYVCDFYKRNYDYLSRWEPNLNDKLLSLEAMEMFMKADMKNMLLGSSVRYWFSFKNSPERIIGGVNFQDIKRGAFKSCQIGYKIDEDFSGRGLTKEAVHCAISSMFTDEKLHRVEALIAVDNLPSVRLSESLGFTKEGVSREFALINGDWKDCFQYSLLEGELKGLPQQM